MLSFVGWGWVWYFPQLTAKLGSGPPGTPALRLVVKATKKGRGTAELLFQYFFWFFSPERKLQRPKTTEHRASLRGTLFLWSRRTCATMESVLQVNFHIYSFWHFSIFGCLKWAVTLYCTNSALELISFSCILIFMFLWSRLEDFWWPSLSVHEQQWLTLQWHWGLQVRTEKCVVCGGGGLIHKQRY